ENMNIEPISNTWNSISSLLPSLISGILLILVAWLLAFLFKKAVVKGLEAVNFNKKLNHWGAVKTNEQGTNMIQTLGQALYYLIWIVFLPGIFETFNLHSVAEPIQNMIDTVLTFLPKIIISGILIAVAVIAGRFIKNLVYNLALTIDLDGWIRKLTQDSSNDAVEKTVSDAGVKTKKDTLATVAANIVYILVIIPIVIVALEVLNIQSISEPIIGVLNTILAAIPNILVATILLVIGLAIAKFIGDLTTNLLTGAGISQMTENIGLPAKEKFNIEKIAGQIVTALISLFFFVEALNALNLGVLNAIGGAIIAYLPNVLFAVAIFAIAFLGGQWLSNLVTKTSGSKWAGRTVQSITLAFALFMVLDQLQFASTIVNTGFMFIIGGLALAFAIAFGLGGRDFASKQLEKLDGKVDKEAKKADTPEE
ncbi:MAG: mechanosensitive ion channel, partial [Staphylococcus equorum]|nr:mechanosensitive ion channel [Staphylococcus equorum]